MRTFAFAASALFALAFSSSAFATTAREAIKLCERNPKCSYSVRDNGSVDLTVNGEGGTSHVNCPQEGPCTCDICIRAPGGGSAVKSTLAPKVKTRAAN